MIRILVAIILVLFSADATYAQKSKLTRTVLEETGVLRKANVPSPKIEAPPAKSATVTSPPPNSFRSQGFSALPKKQPKVTQPTPLPSVNTKATAIPPTTSTVTAKSTNTSSASPQKAGGQQLTAATEAKKGLTSSASRALKSQSGAAVAKAESNAAASVGQAERNLAMNHRAKIDQTIKTNKASAELANTKKIVNQDFQKKLGGQRNQWKDRVAANNAVQAKARPKHSQASASKPKPQGSQSATTLAANVKSGNSQFRKKLADNKVLSTKKNPPAIKTVADKPGQSRKAASNPSANTPAKQQSPNQVRTQQIEAKPTQAKVAEQKKLANKKFADKVGNQNAQLKKQIADNKTAQNKTRQNLVNTNQSKQSQKEFAVNKKTADNKLTEKVQREKKYLQDKQRNSTVAHQRKMANEKNQQQKANGLRSNFEFASQNGAKVDSQKIQRPFSLVSSQAATHKNSLSYVGDTHVYGIKGHQGAYKVGESAQGTRQLDGASIRAEQQARRLWRETGQPHMSSIRNAGRPFPNKRVAREYETTLIERFRRRYGQKSLPGNKTNR